jgi:hypothetical protein
MNEVPASVARMAAALGEWDRNIAALEARATLERDEASRDRRYQIGVELAIAYRARGHLAAGFESSTRP